MRQRASVHIQWFRVLPLSSAQGALADKPARQQAEVCSESEGLVSPTLAALG